MPLHRDTPRVLEADGVTSFLLVETRSEPANPFGLVVLGTQDTAQRPWPGEQVPDGCQAKLELGLQKPDELGLKDFDFFLITRKEGVILTHQIIPLGNKKQIWEAAHSGRRNNRSVSC